MLVFTRPVKRGPKTTKGTKLKILKNKVSNPVAEKGKSRRKQ
jgi:hypothetical protein